MRTSSGQAANGPDAAERPAARMPIDDARLRRIRWRCRRGMLENDLVLTRFLDRYGDALTDADVVSLDALLDMSDNALWDVIAGRAEPDAAHAAFVTRLRAL